MIDLADGFYLVKFDMPEDYSKVYSRGPWIILNHYLTVRKWKHNFNPDNDPEKPTVV